MSELYKIIHENRELLHTARINFDKPEKLREVMALLSAPVDPAVSAAAAAKEHRRSSSSASSASSSNLLYHHHQHAGAGGGGPTSSPVESLLQRVTIIGEILAFRDLLTAALNDVLEQRVPFLMGTLCGLIDSLADETQKVVRGNFDLAPKV